MRCCSRQIQVIYIHFARDCGDGDDRGDGDAVAEVTTDLYGRVLRSDGRDQYRSLGSFDFCGRREWSGGGEWGPRNAWDAGT